MEIGRGRRVGKLADEDPFLVDFLASYSENFNMLRNPLRRKTVGQFATTAKAAKMRHVDSAEVLEAVAQVCQMGFE